MALMTEMKPLFYQVIFPGKDTDLLCCISCGQSDLTQRPKESVGATSSPYGASSALRRKAENARYNLAEEVVQRVLQNIYIDDYLNSVSSREPCRCISKTAQE